jgi:hypothetical protein
LSEVGDGGGEGAAVLVDEVGEGAEEGAEVVGAETLREVPDAFGGALELGHEEGEVGLFAGLDGPFLDPDRAGGAAFDGDEVLAHEAGELDEGLAVGVDVVVLGIAIDLQQDMGLAAHELDRFDVADLDTGHFHQVALLEFLRAPEPGGDVIAFAQEVGGADQLENDHSDDEGEGEEDAEAGFEGVLHGVWEFRVKSALRKR